MSRTSAPSGRVRATIFTIGSVTAETRRLTPTGHVGMRNARRVSGLTRQGSGPDVRPPQLVEQPIRGLREPQAERRTDVAIPGAEQHFAQALALAFGRHHDVHAPGSPHLLPGDRHLHRHRRVLADDGRTLARDPDLRLAARVVGIAQYCQSQRRRLASAASCPNTRRYSASTTRRSSAR